jgi:hypothetical protein
MWSFSWSVWLIDSYMWVSQACVSFCCCACEVNQGCREREYFCMDGGVGIVRVHWTLFENLDRCVFTIKFWGED